MKKILVIDDNVGILDALRAALTLFGYEVKCAVHSKEAFGYIATFKPDLVILDLLLSGENGKDVCIALKADEHTKHLPIIMMSAHPSALETITQSGADDFLAKPFSIHELATLAEKYGNKTQSTAV